MINIIEYANALQIIVLAQALRIEQMRRQLDANSVVLQKSIECIDDLTKTILGKH